MFSPSTSVFPCQYHSTNVPYTSASTSYSYQDKRAKPGNLPKNKALSQMDRIVHFTECLWHWSEYALYITLRRHVYFEQHRLNSKVQPTSPGYHTHATVHCCHYSHLPHWLRSSLRSVDKCMNTAQCDEKWNVHVNFWVKRRSLKTIYKTQATVFTNTSPDTNT
jgi:hypothetical protein